MAGFDKNGRKSSTTAKKNIHGDMKMKVKMRLMVMNKKQEQRKRSSYERGKPWWNKSGEEEQVFMIDRLRFRGN